MVAQAKSRPQEEKLTKLMEINSATPILLSYAIGLSNFSKKEGAAHTSPSPRGMFYAAPVQMKHQMKHLEDASYNKFYQILSRSQIVTKKEAPHDDMNLHVGWLPDL